MPHFMLPTTASTVRTNLNYADIQRKSVTVKGKQPIQGAAYFRYSTSSVSSERSASVREVNSTKSERDEYEEAISKKAQDYSHLPRFMRPTRSYISSIISDSMQQSQRVVPSKMIREVSEDHKPRYMCLTSTTRKRCEDMHTTQFMVTRRLQPKEVKPETEDDEMERVAINELRRVLTDIINQPSSSIRLSSNGEVCTAIKKRDPSPHRAEEKLEEVKMELPRFMRSTRAAAQRVKEEGHRKRRCRVCRTNERQIYPRLQDIHHISHVLAELQLLLLVHHVQLAQPAAHGRDRGDVLRALHPQLDASALLLHHHRDTAHGVARRIQRLAHHRQQLSLITHYGEYQSHPLLLKQVLRGTNSKTLHSSPTALSPYPATTVGVRLIFPGRLNPLLLLKNTHHHVP